MGMVKVILSGKKTFLTLILISVVIIGIVCYLYFYYYPEKKHSQLLGRMNTLLNKAEELGLAGKQEEAIEVLRKVIESEPAKSNEKEISDLISKAYRFWGNALRLQGKYEEAIEKYLKALQLNQESGAALYGMGLAFMALGRYEEALKVSEEMERLQPPPGVIFTYHLAAKALMELKKYPECLTKCEKSLRLDPNDAEIYYLKGICLAYLEKNEEAIASFEKATRIDSNNGWSFLWWGKLLKNMNNYKEAQGKYQEALEAFKKTNDITGEKLVKKHIEEIEFLIKKGKSSSKGFSSGLGSLLLSKIKEQIA